MGGLGINSGRERDTGELSWTNEALPLEVRRALLDKALDDLRKARAADTVRVSSARVSGRAGKAGADRDPPGGKDSRKA
jgi:hypothetical protein